MVSVGLKYNMLIYIQKSYHHFTATRGVVYKIEDFTGN